MKKFKLFGELNFCSLKKILLIMRFAIILLILGIVQAHADETYSQKTRLSINFSDTQLVTVLDKIEDESEFFFLYNEKLLDTNRKVSINATNQLIGAVLDKLFMGTDVKYTIIDRKIILAPDYLTEAPEVPLRIITGTVTDKNGAPLPGVNVYITGTTQGTTTDMAGKYRIDVPQGTISLTFSYVGMVAQEIAVGVLSEINVTMIESAFGLDEVIVIGYGTVKKSDLTGSVSSISSKSLQQAVPFDVTRSLQGKAAGVRINQKSGRPGEDVIIRIRGGNSLSGGNNPLYVIDGFPVDNLGADFNPEDIASIEILKDASATAIYGSRGAGGVVLITTKRGVSGKTQINYHGSVGVQSLRHKIDLLDKNGFVAMQNEIAAKEGGTVLTPAQIAALPDNDW